MKMVPGIDKKAFSLQQSRGMLEWPQADVMETLRTVHHMKVSANPVYYFALFRTALNYERRENDAKTLAMSEVMNIFGEQNYKVLFECIGGDFELTVSGFGIKQSENMDKWPQKKILGMLKEANAEKIREKPALYIALLSQASENRHRKKNPKPP